MSFKFFIVNSLYFLEMLQNYCNMANSQGQYYFMNQYLITSVYNIECLKVNSKMIKAYTKLVIVIINFARLVFFILNQSNRETIQGNIPRSNPHITINSRANS